MVKVHRSDRVSACASNTDKNLPVRQAQRDSTNDKMESRPSSRMLQKSLHNRKKTVSTDIQSESWDVKSRGSTTTTGTNGVFFQACNERSRTTSYSWKSQSMKVIDDFNRMQRMIRYVAPEQFRNPAKPSDGPCDIVPTNLREYIEHSKDILEMKTRQMEKNIIARREAVRLKSINETGEIQPRIESKFGEQGKTYLDGLSPVLCQPTMWSAEYGLLGLHTANWPTHVELQESGDKRQLSEMGFQPDRHLPPPRCEVPTAASRDCLLMQSARRITDVRELPPLDEHRPLFRQGPPQMEIWYANASMDRDEGFEACATIWLGKDLMEHLGSRTDPFVPNWLMKRQEERRNRNGWRGDGGVSFLSQGFVTNSAPMFCN